MTAEYEVKDTTTLKRFLDKEIGTEYEIIRNRFNLLNPFEGYLVVFDLTTNEHNKIKEFIKNKNLYLE